MVTTTDRKAELLRRAGIDPIRVDTRPLSIIMDDEIPYQRWERELQVIQRAGYRNWLALLEDRHRAKSHKA